MSGHAGRWSVAGALAALTALAAWPLLRLGYPTTGDGLNHFYRLAQLDHLLRAGVWYPRWAPDLAFGFGYPLFNYYSPLAYYLGALFHAAGLGYAGALLGVYVLALALAITGAYALAAGGWGRAAGLAAAAAYGLAPYFYFNALARGALPETLGLGVLPWVLWAYARLARRPTPAAIVAAALLNTTLILAHLLSALVAAPLVVLVVALETQRVSNTRRIRDYQWPLITYGLSLCLAAFFLLPAVGELGAVQSAQLTQPADLDFRNNFLAAGELFAWPRPYDARLVFNEVPPSLSLAAAGLAVAGAVAAGLRAQGPTLKQGKATWLPRAAGGWALALAALLVLTLPASTFVWERLLLLSLVQFPWRLVGPASLALALLAGAGVGGLARTTGERRWAMPLLLAGALALLWAYSLAWSYGPASAAPASASLASLGDYERSTGQLGTTSAGEFLPRAVRTLPDPLTLAGAYAAGRPAARLAPPPAGVSVAHQSAGPLNATAEVQAAAPATLTFNLFHYPGWRATVDGQPVAITATDPHGLISVPVPAGAHTVAVRFGPTPLRTASSLLSALAVLALILLARRVAAAPPLAHAHRAQPPHASRAAWAFALAALLLLAGRAAFLDPRPSPFARSRFDGATVAGAGRALDGNFDDQLVLIGLDGPPPEMAADAETVLTLYWRAQNPPAADYAATVQVLDADGHLYGQSDSQHPGRVPTSRWQPGQYAADSHHLRLLPGTPPGTYRLVAGVYRVGGPPLPVLDASHVPIAQAAELGPLTVTPARRPAAPDPAQPLQAALGPLTLRGYSLSTAAPQAGDELRLTLFWEAGRAPRPNVAVRLTLAAADGAVLVEETRPPTQAAHPASAWAAGEVVRSARALRVPANVPAGPATLWVSLVPLDAPGGPPLAPPLALAALDLRVPERAFEPPPMQHALNAALGAQVTLLGYDLAPSGQLVLYWQAGALLDTSYKVFVHALSPSGEILAQADTLPAGGARPTTGWLPGEIVTDPHALPLDGATQLAVGLYDEASGQRLGRVELGLP